MKQIANFKKTDGGLFELSGITVSGEEKTITADLDHVSMKIATAAYMHKCPVAIELIEDGGPDGDQKEIYDRGWVYREILKSGQFIEKIEKLKFPEPRDIEAERRLAEVVPIIQALRHALDVLAAHIAVNPGGAGCKKALRMIGEAAEILQENIGPDYLKAREVMREATS